MEDKLNEYSTEQLLEEIERRKIQDEFFLCLGIIDDLGVEGLVPVKTHEEFSTLHNSLSLRARFNGHRNAKVYSIRVNRASFDAIDEILKIGEYERATEMIKNMSTFKIIVS